MAIAPIKPEAGAGRKKLNTEIVEKCQTTKVWLAGRQAEKKSPLACTQLAVKDFNRTSSAKY